VKHPAEDILRHRLARNEALFDEIQKVKRDLGGMQNKLETLMDDLKLSAQEFAIALKPEVHSPYSAENAYSLQTDFLKTPGDQVRPRNPEGIELAPIARLFDCHTSSVEGVFRGIGTITAIRDFEEPRWFRALCIRTQDGVEGWVGSGAVVTDLDVPKTFGYGDKIELFPHVQVEGVPPGTRGEVLNIDYQEKYLPLRIQWEPTGVSYVGWLHVRKI